MPNDWKRIRTHYANWHDQIMAAGRNEWGCDAYAWDEGFISLTPIEEWLWADIRANDAVMYPQYPVGRVFVDFANPVAKVAIECDGAAYHTDKAKDAARDAGLHQLGWTVYRFPGWLCATDSHPETGALGEAHKRLAAICERHGISRDSRTDDGWRRPYCAEDLVAQTVDALSRRAATRAGVRL